MKDTPNHHPIHELFRRRWSPRWFQDRAIPDSDLDALLEAARWAPSSGNGQPWRFLISSRGEQAYDDVISTLAAGNQAWAVRAPVLILSFAETTLRRKGKPTRENRHAFYDVGQAVGHMALEAASRGIYLHQMGGFDPQKAEELFQAPPEFSAVSVIALGYLAQKEDLSEEAAAQEYKARVRHPIEGFSFRGRFGQAYR